MRISRVIPTIMASAACGLSIPAVASAASSDASDVAQTSSANWSGYVVGDPSAASRSSFRSVTGSWVQPAARCTRGAARSYAAFWVGLGGSGASAAEGQGDRLEQAGTEVDCTARGTARYHAWYELVPAAPVTVDLAIHAGDHLTATTTVDGHEVTNTIVDHTTGGTFSKTVRMADPDTSSAEWIAEAPSRCDAGLSQCTLLPLTDFGTVRFTDARATDTAGHAGGIADADWTPVAITLDPSDGSAGGGWGASAYAGAGDMSGGSLPAGASPSSLGDRGSAFSVTYAGGERPREETEAAGSPGGGAVVVIVVPYG